MNNKEGNGKGYVIRDRRLFTQDGELRENVEIKRSDEEKKESSQESKKEKEIIKETPPKEEHVKEEKKESWKDKIFKKFKKDEVKTEEEKKDSKEEPHIMPEINFSTFIISLHTASLYHLGLLAEPSTDQREVNLPLAKQTIDTIEMLRDKTKGNLTEEEKNLIDNVLYDLRLRYVEVVQRINRA